MAQEVPKEPLAGRKKRAALGTVGVLAVAALAWLALCGTAAPGRAPPTAADPHDGMPGALAAEPKTAEGEGYLSPVALVASRDGRTLYVAEATGKRVACFDVTAGKVVAEIALPDPPNALALSPDGARLYVTGASPEGQVHVIELKELRLTASLPVGHTPSALAVAPDGKTLYVCNRFNHNVSVVDLEAGKEIVRIPVIREPVAAALTPDGKCLFVANHLPAGPANGDFIAAAVSIIGAATRQVEATVQLPNGSTNVRGLCLSPDGQSAYVTHILGHYQVPTTQLERGWMCTNALSVISVPERKRVNTVLLDDVDQGAANPWGVACTGDGRLLCVAHAGSHEASTIDRAGLHDRLSRAAAGQKVSDVSSSYGDVSSDLGFLVGLRRRLKLPGRGPRGVALIGAKLYAAEYFSDTLSSLDLQPDAPPGSQSFALGPARPPTPVRRGESLFNDAERCFQKWQSCASCHPDARADGLNWDLMNDGFGNPKNTKSMLLAHQTPPMMALGIRETAEKAVRAGFKFIQFVNPPEEECVAVDEYLKSLQPVPSPYLVKGRLSPAAQRGEQLYETAGCASCHPAPLLTDLRKHDLGLGAGVDQGKPFDTPTLREVWRTAPYLYDGRAVTLKEALTKYNPDDAHGAVSDLKPEDLAALLEYVLSQ